jgi:hypothetical protein
MRRSIDIVNRVGASVDTTTTRSALGEMYALSGALNTSIVRWTDDTRFVLDQLTAMSTPHAGLDTIFAGKLATDRVGVFGMSFGGATAASFCLADARCAAGMNFDGLLYGDASNVALTRPFFFASSDKNESLHRLFHERAQGPSWLMRVGGSAHMDYTDFSFFAPKLAARVGMLGGIAPTRMHAIMNDIALPYFDAALRGGKGIDAAAFRSRYPEATLVMHAGRPAPNATAAPSDNVQLPAR